MQDVKMMEKKWRKKVKEARAEKESLRSELAGRLALLADRMTQLASKEARHESRQCTCHLHPGPCLAPSRSMRK